MTKVAISGVLATGIDVTLLVAMVELATFKVAFATFLASLTAAVVNFWVNKRWAFQSSTRVSFREVFAFGIVALGTASLLAALVFFLTSVGSVPYLLAKVLAAIAVFLTWSYPAQSKVVFSR